LARAASLQHWPQLGEAGGSYTEKRRASMDPTIA
jgi:hypothetical protein